MLLESIMSKQKLRIYIKIANVANGVTKTYWLITEVDAENLYNDDTQTELIG